MAKTLANDDETLSTIVIQSDLNTSVPRNSIKISKVGNKIASMKDNKTVGGKLESPKNWNVD